MRAPPPEAIHPAFTHVRIGLILLGLALAGFFDGILLHQVLQWHHLLSGLGTSIAADLRFQVMADGVFHAAMYVIAVVGLLKLAKHRYVLALMRLGGILVYGLVGFSAWHFIDAILFHWILGLHHVRMDSGHPFLWDLGWLAIFGLGPLIIAWVLLAHRGLQGPPGNGLKTTKVLTIAALAGALLNAVPPLAAADRTSIVILLPGTARSTAFSIAHEADASVLSASRDGSVWLIGMSEERKESSLFHAGAFVIPTSNWLTGCLASFGKPG